ncbi:MAG: hypothetical protein ACRD8O_19055 [Bryobacteraceae bacterium]
MHTIGAAKRRHFLQGSAVAPAVVAAQRTPDNRTVEENRKPGAVDWQLQYTDFDYPAAYQSSPLIRGLRSPAIEGFGAKPSVAHGESIEFKISTRAAAMGDYSGKGGRHVLRLGSFKSKPQPVPGMTLQGLRECAWETAATLVVPEDWVRSGRRVQQITRNVLNRLIRDSKRG